MRRDVSLNHVPDRGLGNPWGITLLVAGIASAIGLLAWLKQLNTEFTRLNTDRQQIQQPVSASPKLAAKESQEKQQEIAAVRDSIDELSLPWQNLFTALENMNNPNIRLASVEPNARQRKLKITASTTDILNMFRYIHDLSDQRVFNDILLMSHEYRPGQPVPVRFTVEAAWVQQ